MVHIHVEHLFAAPAERVFDWLADPANLTAARLMLGARWVNGSAPSAGAALEAISGPLLRSGFVEILAGCARALES